MEPFPATSSGRRFGKYTLVAKLAQGGMAEIFLARLGGAAGFEKLVCIKRILPEYAKDQQFVAMFLAEAKIAARISHPNVCQVFELGALEGRYYIAMEYLEGVPVSTLRRPQLYPSPPDVRLVAGVAIQACEGLHHAHSLKGAEGDLGVVHRDVSPQNLFVTTDGIVKVLDFGIAKVQNASQKTMTGTVKGTYAYMPPEQLRGEAVDRRSDVFAMAAVIWELLARRHLFRRETDFLTFQAITTDPIPDVCMFRPDVPPAIGRALTCCLSRDRDARLPTARMLGQALSQALAPLGGPLPPAAIGEEIAAAFAGEIDEQRRLIDAARAGSEFDLDTETHAPGFGLVDPTTPVSALKRRSDALEIPLAPPSVTMSVVEPRPSSTYPVAPEARSGLWIVLLLVLVAAGGGAGAVYYFFVVRAAPQLGAGPAVAAAEPTVQSSNTATNVAAAVIDAAGVPPEPLDAAPVITPTIPEDAAASVIDPAPEVAPKQPPRPTRAPKPAVKPPPPPAAPAGPPGTITIDSTPVYATIYIDGKKLGETPLLDIKLAPGKHSVRAVSSSGGTQNLSITIEPGKKARGRRIEW